MALSSVQVTLYDDAGATIEDATLTYTGGGFEDQPCDPINGQYVCGWEVSGEIVITIEAQGFETETLNVTVEDGLCHVVTELVDVTLTPST